MENKQTLLKYLFVLAFGIILFIPFIGEVDLFDWDEINFAEAAREMLTTGDYLTVRIDYEPFHEKPPLFIWLQVISMKVFGVNEFAARLPNALIGVLSLLFLFYIGIKLIDEKFGLLLVLTYSSSILPHFYFKTGLIDPAFNLLMFGSIYFLFRSFNEKIPNSSNNVNNNIKDKAKTKINYLLLAGILDGLAILTKGPVGYLLVIITAFIFWLFNKKGIKLPLLEFVLFTLMAFVPIILWYIALGAQYGFKLIPEFINYQIRLFSTQDAGHGGPIYFHLIVLLFGVFPSSVFAFRGFRKQIQDIENIKQFSLWMMILLLVVLVIFSIVKTKIIHYSSLAYYPIAFFAAKGIYGILYNSTGWKKSTNWLLAIIGFPIAIAALMLPIAMMNIDLILPRIKDIFTFKILSGNYYWAGNEWLAGAILFLGLLLTFVFIDKRKYLLSITSTYASTLIFVVLLLPLLVPRIEQYTQLTPINFIKKLQGNNCYVITYGYKSFAQYFYLQQKFNQSAISKNMSSADFENWLLTGNIDKPAFFIAKYQNKDKLLNNPNLTELYEKNGWVFFYRSQ
jgi:4-amino-4-deoxy-L-arabinose transferase-like glycosyltransferase